MNQTATNMNMSAVKEAWGDDEEEEQMEKELRIKKFGGNSLIERENEIIVANILEKKANEQLSHLCGWWNKNISSYNTEIIHQQILIYWKWMSILLLLDIFWVCGSCIAMPTAGMHAIQSYITDSSRLQMVIYWWTNIFLWICIGWILSKPSGFKCKLALGINLLNILWHIVEFVSFQLFPNDRQNYFELVNALIYWIECLFSIGLIAVSLQLLLKLSALASQTHPISKMMQDQSILDNSHNIMNPRQDGIILQDFQQQDYQNEHDKSLMMGQVERNNLIVNRNVVVDNIENDNTAIVSVFQRNWRTHYGEYAPEIKKRRILTSNVIRSLEEELKASRKIKLQSQNATQQYEFFDLHFNNGHSNNYNMNSKMTDRSTQQQQQVQSNIRQQLASTLKSNKQLTQSLAVPAQGQSNLQKTSFDIQSVKRSARNIEQSQTNIHNNGNLTQQQQQPQQKEQQQQQQQQQQQPQSMLSMYGEQSIGFNQKNQEFGKLNQSHDQSLRATSQSQFRLREQQKESEYFRAKATVAEVLEDKKKRWGNAPQLQPAKTFNFEDQE